MYMYYLLGFRLCGGHDDQLWKGAKDANAKDQRRKTQFAPGSIFKYLPEEIARKVRLKGIGVNSYGLPVSFTNLSKFDGSKRHSSRFCTC